MTSLLAQAPIIASGVFSSLSRGESNLRAKWDIVAGFSGAIIIIVAVIFLLIAFVKTREKLKWFGYSALAFVGGAILLMAGATNMIQGGFSDSWNEVFGVITYLAPLT